MILITAPITVVIMLIFANPCVVINGFIPITIENKKYFQEYKSLHNPRHKEVSYR